MDGDGSEDSEGRAASNELSNDIPSEYLASSNHELKPLVSGDIMHEIMVVHQERSSIQLGNSARTATPPSWDWILPL
jgi:hypothetical protein